MQHSTNISKIIPPRLPPILHRRRLNEFLEQNRKKRLILILGQAAQGMVNAEISNMLSGKFISDYDAFLAKKIAYVLSGGDVRDNAEVGEDVILTLEREAFVDLLKEEKTMARIEHMLSTGKPLRN